MPDAPPRVPLARARARAARPRGPPVGHPPLLRHRRDDGRRHQPRHRRARLRHAEADRRGRRPEPARGPDALHVQLRDPRAAPGPVRPPGARYGVRYDPAREILVTVGASEAVDLALRATCDPGDEVILHEPSYVAYSPAIMFSGGSVACRRRASRTTSRWTPPTSRPPSRRGPRRCSSATRATRPAPCCRRASSTRSPGSPAPRPARVQRRDLRPAGLRRPTATARSRAAGHARADDPDGRVLQGLRDDRLAGRVPVRTRRDRSRASSRCTSTGSCRPATTAQDGALEALRSGEADVQRMLAEYDRRRRILVDGLNALGLPTFEPRGAFYAFPLITSTGLSIGGVRRRSPHRGARRVRPGRRLRPERRGPRPDVLRNKRGEAPRGTGPHRAILGKAPTRSARG